jgi:hypothetical protein
MPSGSERCAADDLSLGVLGVNYGQFPVAIDTGSHENVLRAIDTLVSMGDTDLSANSMPRRNSPRVWRCLKPLG